MRTFIGFLQRLLYHYSVLIEKRISMTETGLTHWCSNYYYQNLFAPLLVKMSCPESNFGLLLPSKMSNQAVIVVFPTSTTNGFLTPTNDALNKTITFATGRLTLSLIPELLYGPFECSRLSGQNSSYFGRSKINLFKVMTL
jgi:hypothetical protein